tara:strand:- start:1056 stop:1691 length:636 start_codon:yes stop_codon:yes gene_type:complete
MTKELKKRFLSSIILIPVTFFFIFQESILFIFFLSILFFITSYEWVKMNNDKDFMKLLGIFFLLFSFYSTFQIRINYGINFFLWVIMICIFTDIGGYVCGNIFKGPKLTKISPKKTYSGVLGGFVFALIVGLSLIKFFKINFLETIPLKVVFIISIISLISQLGDLIISYFKRKAKLKDTGNILPGHGGLLDRVDGLIFVMPVIYLRILIL